MRPACSSVRKSLTLVGTTGRRLAGAWQAPPPRCRAPGTPPRARCPRCPFVPAAARLRCPRCLCARPLPQPRPALRPALARGGAPALIRLFNLAVPTARGPVVARVVHW